MRVAVATNGAAVSHHFGQCGGFLVADVADGQITSCQQVGPPQHSPGAYPAFLHSLGITHVVAGGIGGKAQGLFASLDIQCIPGVTGDAHEAVSRLVTGQLTPGESLCDHPQGHACSEADRRNEH